MQAIAFEDAFSYLSLFAGDSGDIRGQAVFIKCAPTPGESHHLFRAFPVGMSGILGKAVLFEVLEPLLVSFFEESGALLHHCHGRPALGIDDVRILEGILHIMREPE